MSVNATGRFARVGARLAVAVVAVVMTLLLAGTFARNALRKSNPPPGRLVEVNGHRMHIHCQGSGAPTVVLDAGLMDFSVMWSPVQASVSAFTRVCSYDRIGLGWSEGGSAARSSAAAVSDLEALLSAADVAPPYVLVGHSYGGINVRRFAQRNPARVAGLVLVDGAHPDQMRRVPELATAMESTRRQFQSLTLMAPLGLLALKPGSIPDRGLPDESARQYRAVLAASGYFQGALAEVRAVDDLFSAQPGDGTHLGHIPLVVVSRGRADIMPQLTPHANRRLEEEWQLMQRDLLSLSRRSTQLIAMASGHDIHIRQPEIVIRAIRTLLGVDGDLP